MAARCTKTGRGLAAPGTRHARGFPTGPVVKICGLTRVEDVLAACRLGAWAVGFVFAPSPRRLTPAAARDLIEQAAEALRMPARGGAQGVLGEGPGPVLPLTVGVFGDSSAEEVATVVTEVGLDGVQLHGLAGAGGRAVRAALAGGRHRRLVIQALPVDLEASDAGALARSVAAARAEADVVLLDTRREGRFGGGGAVFPWELARAAGDGRPLLVAGGIGPDNVALALLESGAWGVDVSSGVEAAPGIKDPARMERLFAGVYPAERTRARPGARDGAAGTGGVSTEGAPADAGGVDPPSEG